MYLPFVFGRQSELLALREITKTYTGTGRIVPVIEPVVKKPNDLMRCLAQFGEAKARAIVILNPDQGEFKVGNFAPWQAELDAVLTKYPTLLPGMKCGPKTNYATVEAFMKKYSQRQVSLLYFNPGLDNAQVKTFASEANIAFHIALQGKMTEMQRKLLPASKAVDIFDHFNKQARNADYSGSEHFTDRHQSYKTSGVGFGDYTVTGSIFQPGGGKPGAVAVHASFKHPASKNVWVQHFVSDDTDINTGSAASKYLEAVSKIASEAPKRMKEFGNNTALMAYLDDHQNGHYPGLGKSKQRQIYHHIALMHDILHGSL